MSTATEKQDQSCWRKCQQDIVESHFQLLLDSSGLLDNSLECQLLLDNNFLLGTNHTKTFQSHQNNSLQGKALVQSISEGNSVQLGIGHQ